MCGGKTGDWAGMCVSGMVVDGGECVEKRAGGVPGVAGGRCGVLSGSLVGRESGVDGGMAPVWDGVGCCVWRCGPVCCVWWASSPQNRSSTAVVAFGSFRSFDATFVFESLHWFLLKPPLLLSFALVFEAPICIRVMGVCSV